MSRSPDFDFEARCKRNPVEFFVDLLQGHDYPQLAGLALLLYCIAPDTVDAERGFNAMKFVRNAFPSRLKPATAIALMSIAADGR